jgi:fatty acid desaturase
LVGGAIASIVFMFPAIKAGMKGMFAKKTKEELPGNVYTIGIVGAFVAFTSIAMLLGISVVLALLIGIIAVAWIWITAPMIAECTGRTDWSPISGLALVTAMICVLLTKNIVIGTILAAAVCTALAGSKDS